MKGTHQEIRAETGGAGLQVVFGTGPVGCAVADHLLAQGLRVRVVNRRGRLPAAWPGGKASGLEILSADAMDLSAAGAASAGASHIYHCLHAPYNMWEQVLPTLYSNLISAATRAGAVLAIAQNLYMYARGVPVIDEETREDPPSRKGRLIRHLHEKLVEAGARDGLRWAVVRASDFYGPLATEQSLFGTARFLDPLFAGKRPLLIGDIDKPHTYTYVGDYGRALSTAALCPEAHGRAWIVPNDRTLTTRAVAELFFSAAGRAPRIQRASHTAIALLGLFNPVIHEILEVLYQKEEPYVVDGSRFREAFHFEATPLEEGVGGTLEWYEGVRRSARREQAS
jgi:nucleoside-diphosphate-sugar epimerase